MNETEDHIFINNKYIKIIGMQFKGINQKDISDALEIDLHNLSSHSSDLFTVTLATILTSFTEWEGAHGSIKSPRMGSRTRMGWTDMIIMWEKVTSPTSVGHTKAMIYKTVTHFFFLNALDRCENEHKCDPIAPSSMNSKTLQEHILKFLLLYLQNGCFTILFN